MTSSVVSAAMFCLLAYVVPNDTGRPPRSAPSHRFHIGSAGELDDVDELDGSDASDRVLLPTARNVDTPTEPIDDDDAEASSPEVIEVGPISPDPAPTDAQPRGTPP
jgi:hypothetical protein